MDGTNLPLFEYFATDCSTSSSAADTATATAVANTIAVDTLVPPAPRTFADAITCVEASDWAPNAKGVLKTHLGNVAWGMSVVNARASGLYLDPVRRNLDLAGIPFDLATINQALAGVPYRMADFSSDKSYRNAMSGLRRIGRELGMVEPLRAPELPPDSPYAPFLAVAVKFEVAAARRFAAKMMQQGRLPGDVMDEDLRRYAIFLATQMVGVKVKPMLRRIVQLWRRTAERTPSWPQTRLQLDCGVKFSNPPFSAYPVSLQEEIAAIGHWLKGSIGTGPFDKNARKPLRPPTIKLHLAHIRGILGAYVSLGNEASSVASLRDLLSPEVIEPILQAIWQREQTRRQGLPEAERNSDQSGNTGQTEGAGRAVVMLAEYFEVPDVQKQLQWLSKRLRRPPMTEMTPKNQKRIDQFLDPIKRGLLLNLPGTLMAEAMELRERQPAEAARLARTAIFFAIELRIPLRMKNLHTCRLGYNLRFAGAGSPTAILSFQGHEMKNGQNIEFGISGRLCQTLQTYIEHFLPWFAEASQDFAGNQWLFPAGDGKAGPLSHGQVRKTIIDTVAERVGAEFHPHLFRGLAVAFCLERDPGGLEHCRQLLGDKTLQVILTHYAAVRTKQAAERQDALVNEEADRLAILASPVKRRRKAGDHS